MAAAAAQWAVVMAVAAAATLAGGDMNADKTECADQLVGLAPCLQYVQGQARAPPPDCCGGLRQVLGKSPKCLCVLVKDKDDPNLGIKINATLALALPSACGATRANASHCARTPLIALAAYSFLPGWSLLRVRAGDLSAGTTSSSLSLSQLSSDAMPIASDATRQPSVYVYRGDACAVLVLAPRASCVSCRCVFSVFSKRLAGHEMQLDLAIWKCRTILFYSFFSHSLKLTSMFCFEFCNY